MLDQLDVEGIHEIGRYFSLEQLLGLNGAKPLRDKAETFRHTVDMRVDREGGLAEREELNAGRRLRADAGEASEPGPGFIRR
jgi:hypothetical protein